jgi:1-acyl-sn-glycerol-3-phosphate acyltransferase
MQPSRWKSTLLQWACKPVFRLLFQIVFPLRVEGADVLKQYKGPVILTGNHTGFLDGPIVIRAIRRNVAFIVAEGVLHWPVVGKLVKLMNIIVLDQQRPLKGLKETLKSLKSQQTVCIFPEGKLSENGEMLQFQSGVVFLQKLSRVPVIPFVIHGGYEAWPWGQWIPSPRKRTIQFGSPILNKGEERAVLLEKLKQTMCRMKRDLESRENLAMLRKSPGGMC